MKQVKRWLPAALFAASLTWAVPALAQGAPGPIILAKNHPTHAKMFASRLPHDAYWRKEVRRKGYDVAFNGWMQQDHPFEYAHYCIEESNEVVTVFKNTEHYHQFDALLPKRADLRSEVKSLGFDTAFADWLRREHPDLYRQHFGLENNHDWVTPDPKTAP